MRDNEVASPPRIKASAEMIVETAEYLFRRYGYQKTTVADVARKLEMSPANVYRFFRSKEEVRRAVFSGILDQHYSLARAVSRLPLDARCRIERYLYAQHSITIGLLNNDREIFDLIVFSTDRDVDLVDAHMVRISNVLATVIADGIERKEFAKQNPQHAAMTFITATAALWHPGLLVGSCVSSEGGRFDDLVDFALNALKSTSTKTMTG